MTAHSRHIILIGLRCSGKSTTGRLLAERLGAPFLDLDDLVLDRFVEPTVREVWAAHGEHAWREAELAALHDALAAPPQVLALGGGTPEIPEARAVLADAVQRSQATIIYLRADADTLAARLRAETGDRPSITRADPAAEVDAQLQPVLGRVEREDGDRYEQRDE